MAADGPGGRPSRTGGIAMIVFMCPGFHVPGGERPDTREPKGIESASSQSGCRLCRLSCLRIPTTSLTQTTPQYWPTVALTQTWCVDEPCRSAAFDGPHVRQ
jgi:hypothetical protein